MLKIRLKRVGKKKRPFYKIVLMKSLARRDGKAILELGYYDPLNKYLNTDKALVEKYLCNGAYPTSAVRHLINKLAALK